LISGAPVLIIEIILTSIISYNAIAEVNVSELARQAKIPSSTVGNWVAEGKRLLYICLSGKTRFYKWTLSFLTMLTSRITVSSRFFGFDLKQTYSGQRDVEP
jgi:hypothetical protein